MTESRKKYYKYSWKRKFYLWLASRMLDISTLFCYLRIDYIARYFTNLCKIIIQKYKDIPWEPYNDRDN